MVMQTGFEKYDYGLLCKEVRERCDLLAPRDVVLSRSKGVVMGTSSLEQKLQLAALNDQDTSKAPQATEEQDQRWSEAEFAAHLDAVGKGKGKGNN